MNKFSVLLSVYHKEIPKYLDTCLRSIIDQTLPADEIVIVIDGPIGVALQEVLNFHHKKQPGQFKFVQLATNSGLGKALNEGLKACSHDIVARMDTDDIALRSRFEEQLGFLLKNPDFDAVGSSILEFETDPAKPLHLRSVPTTPEAIASFAKRKNPMNHMTVIFRKSSVLKAGGYEDVPYFEDYYLWVKMLSAGMKFYNIPVALVLARIGNDMIGKRHGIAYLRHEVNFFKKIRTLGFISTFMMVTVLSMRLPFRLMPKKILALFYNFALRKKTS